MKLSIGMIAEVLKDLDPLCLLHNFDRILNLEHCVFYDGDLKLHSDTVYIFTKEIIKNYSPLSLSAESGTAIVYLGDPEDYTPSSRASFICISSEKISAANLSNRIYLCFERYRKIDAELQEIVWTSNDIMKLVKLATPLFQNELTVRDRLYRYVAHSYKEIRYTTVYGSKHGDTFEITPLDEVNSLKNDPLYHEQISTQAPWFYQYGDYQMWCYDIFINHIFTYRVKLINTNREFRPWDAQLLYYFCSLIKKNMACAPLLEQDHDMTQLFYSLLENKGDIVSQEMTTTLNKIGWDYQDRYLLLCLNSGKNIGKLNPLSYYCVHLHKEYQDTFAIQKAQNIILIVNLSRSYHDDEYEFTHQISEFLRDENFRAGISFFYTPITKTAYAYIQASVALQKGSLYDPELWSYSFKKYRYHYIFGMIFDAFPDYSYLLPELKELKIYDEENNTSFINTLQCYLKNDRNMLKTANDLNMHRSSLAYQLKKIGKIMSCDFEDTQMNTLLNFVLQGLDL